MASIKEIRDHIKSVEQTLKITNAMYLISSSSMRKAKKQLADVEPYFEKISTTISDILHRSPEITHLYFDKRPEKSKRMAAYLVITGDKGLAGAYNHNVIKLAEEQLRLHPQEEPSLFLVGQVGRAHFARKQSEHVIGSFMYTAQNPTMYRAREISDTLLDLFRRGLMDELYMIYTDMVSPMRMEPKIVKLLPLDRDNFPWQKPEGEHYQEIVTYVPSPDAVLSQLVPGYLKGMIFGGLVESYCSEQNSRMSAMDSATKNAKQMLKNLSLAYNQARQSAITQELTEIVAGAQGGGQR